MKYTKEQIKAAYALNLCTVSISQIIDYADVNIMEQEYEAILNNLNLEEMPKDEALLNILKQILDTITFFRIQEGDKQFIEKDYQQKMKNAIWSAVPNIGMIVASGDPVTMAISLASQVGIGYMNYRKAKADIQLENEKQQWELQKVAIEQFNGLRRELFDTAWRLAATHNFPDAFRLTERQISQFNDILMDNNLIRKYERLDVIKDNFEAYPPFWYYFGNTANAIINLDLPLEDDEKEYYKSKAQEYFFKYREVNQQGLLREDQVSASCALELVDLLDFNKDKKLIEELLQEAIRYSGRANDVLQLAALTYLKLNEPAKASALLIQLVNEQYNTVLNAQLLSSAYVADYLKTQSVETRAKYRLLESRVGSDYLYPIPEDVVSTEEIEKQFLETQQKILKTKYDLVFDRFVESYQIRFNKIIPVFYEKDLESTSYFLPDNLERRKQKAIKYFSSKKNIEKYVSVLLDAKIEYEIIGVINDFFDACCSFEFINKSDRYTLAKIVESSIIAKKEFYSDIEKVLKNGKFMLTDMHHLLDISLEDFVGDFIDGFKSLISEYVASRKEMQDFAGAEEILNEFCIREGLPEPSKLFEKDGSEVSVSPVRKPKKFGYYLLKGEEPKKKEPVEENHFPEMLATVKAYRTKVEKAPGKVEFSFSGEPLFERYFRTNSKLRAESQLMADTIAILNDKESKFDFDLLFTVYGIIPVKSGSKKSLVPYSSVKWVEGKHEYINIGTKYEKDSIDSMELLYMIQALSEFVK